ncbi:hypothetical protein DESUT3_03490 [Desulfuromonas versatilis]|uniref:Secreted peptide n=1 Tax=Desulfuromonas versatilis TaxID=2802975 RepID=A0ABM8HRQ1_9BACT|nr:hypothetical protein DESUT3_03490 [Desulfuromonas versatilis]
MASWWLLATLVPWHSEQLMVVALVDVLVVLLDVVVVLVELSPQLLYCAIAVTGMSRSRTSSVRRTDVPLRLPFAGVRVPPITFFSLCSFVADFAAGP